MPAPGRLGQIRERLAAIVRSTTFDLSMALVIVTNSVFIGIEQSFRAHRKRSHFLDGAEHIFLSVYLMELMLRMFVHGVGCFKDCWVCFDALLVGIGTISSWIVMPIIGDESARQFGLLMVLRTARLLRLARALRLLTCFRQLWMLVRSLLNSTGTMLHTFLLLFVILYIFSCLSMELITGNELMTRTEPEFAEFQKIVHEEFHDLPQTLFTLIQFITLDGVSEIYRPLVSADWRLTFFFVALILTVSIVSMNIVTAVIVNSALEHAMHDKDLKKAKDELHRKKMLKSLQDLFSRLDEDSSGKLTRDEIRMIDGEDKELLTTISGSLDVTEIFDMLDADGSGDIGVTEFIDGVWQLALSDAPAEVKRIDKQVSLVREELSSIRQWNEVTLREMNRHLDLIRRRCQSDRKFLPDEPGMPTSQEVGCLGEHLITKPAEVMANLRCILKECTSFSVAVEAAMTRATEAAATEGDEKVAVVTGPSGSEAHGCLSRIGQTVLASKVAMDSNEEADGQSAVVCEDMVLAANSGVATGTTLDWDEDTFAANVRELSLDPVNLSCTWPSNSTLNDGPEKARWVLPPENAPLFSSINQTRAWGEKDAKPQSVFAAPKVTVLGDLYDHFGSVDEQNT
eukprot:TRINITY_DN9142_c0_g1_i1.p1 TRINITY_DN9142_c0_g1~~TRINITY_DN9142_c0_g1_i1.p1  ORF type:complete len:691 (-),score=117.01 TRINITY_DN9142_c0_g1_i1:43-1923(-)